MSQPAIRAQYSQKEALTRLLKKYNNHSPPRKEDCQNEKNGRYRATTYSYTIGVSHIGPKKKKNMSTKISFIYILFIHSFIHLFTYLLCKETISF